MTYLKAFIFSTLSSLSSGFSIINRVLHAFPASYLKCQSICLLISDSEVKGRCFSCEVRMLLCSWFADSVRKPGLLWLMSHGYAVSSS